MIEILLLLAVVFALWLKFTRRPNNYPPGPQWLPIVGNTGEVRKLAKKLGGQHAAFLHLANEYKTEVVGVKLGFDYVVSPVSFATIKEVLTREEFEARPKSFFIKLRCFGEFRGITCTEGEFWSQQRSFVVRHLRDLGFGKDLMNAMIREEFHEMTSKLDENGIQINNLLSPAVINVLWRLVAGNRIPYGHGGLEKLLDLMSQRSKQFDMSGGLLAQFPFVRFLFPNRSGYNLIVDLNGQLKDFLTETIEQHRDTWHEGRKDDLIYSYISEMKASGDPNFTDEQLVVICLDMFIAGAHTTSYTITFAILLMIKYPDIQEKVFSCLKNAFPDDFLPDYSKRDLVPYVEAVLYESQRLLYVAPISGPRRALKDTTIGGYSISKGTTVLLNNYAVNYNPQIWTDPEDFRPERFLDENGSFIQSKYLMPFNIGRRKCPGEVMARNFIFTYFSGMMRNYSVSPRNGDSKPTCKPIPGIIMSPEEYTAVFTPRK